MLRRTVPWTSRVFNMPQSRATRRTLERAEGLLRGCAMRWSTVTIGLWIFDPDGLPAPDALEKMLDHYTGWPRSQQDETAFLTCLHPERWRDSAHRIFTWRGLVPAKPTPGESYYPCDNAWWSGCLYRMAAVREIGLPNADYFLDWGESEYGYRMMRAGFKGFVCRDAPINSNIRGYAALRPAEIERGGCDVRGSGTPSVSLLLHGEEQAIFHALRLR